MAHATERLEIRLTPTDKAALTAAASQSRMPVSRFVRQAVLDRAEATLGLVRSFTTLTSLAYEQLVVDLAEDSPRTSEPVSEPLVRAATRLKDQAPCSWTNAPLEMCVFDPRRHWRDLWSCPDPGHTTWLLDHDSTTSQDVPLTCWVWVPPDQPDVQGYYTVQPHRILRSGALASGEGGIAATMLGRLAVSGAHSRRGVGGMLLADAVRRAVAAVDVDGSRLLVADPHTDLGAAFLEHHGFQRLPGGGPMFQSMARLSHHRAVA